MSTPIEDSKPANSPSLGPLLPRLSMLGFSERRGKIPPLPKQIFEKAQSFPQQANSNLWQKPSHVGLDHPFMGNLQLGKNGPEQRKADLQPINAQLRTSESEVAGARDIHKAHMVAQEPKFQSLESENSRLKEELNAVHEKFRASLTKAEELEDDLKKLEATSKRKRDTDFGQELNLVEIGPASKKQQTEQLASRFHEQSLFLRDVRTRLGGANKYIQASQSALQREINNAQELRLALEALGKAKDEQKRQFEQEKKDLLSKMQMQSSLVQKCKDFFKEMNERGLIPGANPRQDLMSFLDLDKQ